jgi:hypothetical protein
MLRRAGAFTLPDLLVVIGVVMVLVALVAPVLQKQGAKTKQAQCVGNLREITRAVLVYSEDFKGTLPYMDPSPPTGVWWWYKELVKDRVGLIGPSGPRDKVFACPQDRGYEEPRPFHSSSKFDYGSYVFNGVNFPGAPNLAGKIVGSIKEPARTLLMMEWTAHAPLSWHRSRTGKNNHPFYNNAESVVGFVDGRVDFIKIYYDGINPAFTRDPIPGYDYKYSGD